MLFGGVFHRFPDLTVLIEEMRAGWLPWYVSTLSRQCLSSPSLGDWPWPTSGEDMLHRNLRLTPLPGFGDTDALDVLAALPDMVVFSSDYPHQEGNADPIELYRPALDTLDDGIRTAFMANRRRLLRPHRRPAPRRGLMRPIFSGRTAVRSLTIRRTGAFLAAMLALLSGGLTACGGADDGQATGVTTVNDLTAAASASPTPSPPPAASPVTASPTATVRASETRDDPAITPENLSTGPVLEWTEFDPGLDDFGVLETIGDGRVLARLADGVSTKLLLTANGWDWTPIPTPTGVSFNVVNLSGGRWLIAGFESIPPPDDDWPNGGEDEVGPLLQQRIFFSDDQGANWNELEIGDLASQSGASSTPSELWIINSALTSGERMVIGAIGENLEPEPDGHEASVQSRILASDGGAFEQVATYDGWIAIWGQSGYNDNDGFALSLFRGDAYGGPMRESLLTSPDGWEWQETPLHPLNSSFASSMFRSQSRYDGSMWSMAMAADEFLVQRIDGEGDSTTVAALRDVAPFDLAVGPSGLAMLASPRSDAVDFGLGMPSGRIEKDGYELRYNEPEGGITLWDLDGDAPVYVLSPEEVQSETPPEGIRGSEQSIEAENMDEVVLIFEDPETGADLVSFTLGDIMSALDFEPSAASEQPEEVEDPEQWVGWSTDGVNWGWQTLSDAFGIQETKDNPLSMELAVGNGFVVAKVLQFSPYEPPTTALDVQGDGDGSDLNSRWFIATVE